MNDKPIDYIFTPDGVKFLGAKQPERVVLRPGVGEWLAQFEMVAQALQLGMHCGKCGGDVTGKNSESAKTYFAVCRCREFVFRL